MFRILPFIFLFIFQNSFSQKNPELPDWTKASFQKERLKKGLTHKTYRFWNKDCLGLNENINILEVSLKTKKLKFGLASADSYSDPNPFGGTLKPTSEIAQSVGAVAAVNAGFFDMKNGGAVDYIKINGQVFDTSRVYAKQRLPFKQAISAFTIKDNQVKIIKGEQDKGWEDKLDAAYVLLTGPLLLFDKEAQPLAKTAFNDNRHPRTCACVTSDQKLLIVTIDGRAAESEGVSLNELIILLQSLKCKDAINFDGGGSTTMYIKGQPENGVVNYPSDNKKFDHQGERSVSNIFYIR
ncbi:MAG: phosphodiester glycosidase family protein [Cytophagaceae bacterium]|nr:phosphodiester glycosidase family protein [Cytophagaceae bacterium]